MPKISIKIVPTLYDIELQILAPRQTKKVEELYNTINHIVNYDSVEFPCFDGYDIISVPLNKITHFFTMDKKVYIENNIQTLEVKKRLYEIEDFLSEKKFNQFIRVSKTSIVNFEYVKKIDMNISGLIFLVMETGKKISISRRYYFRIKDFLNKTFKAMEE